MPTILYRGSRAQLLTKLYTLPAALAGRAPDPSGACGQLVLTVGVGLMGAAQDNFVRCSEGGVNDLTGEPWEPLAATTLALRRKNTGAKAVAKLEAAFASLPAARQRLVRRQYQRVVQLYGDSAALGTHNGARLRRAALGVLERMKPHVTARRYKTLLAELTKKHKPEKVYRVAYSAAHALLMRDTGALLNSLSPALRGSGEQVLTVAQGVLTVGTANRVAKYHNSPAPRKLKKDGKPRLPRRQFLPDANKTLPPSWWKAATAALAAGLASADFWRLYLA